MTYFYGQYQSKCFTCAFNSVLCITDTHLQIWCAPERSIKQATFMLVSFVANVSQLT